MTAFTDYVNLELPKRTVLFTQLNTGYAGDPNVSVHPGINGAPQGSLFIDSTGPRYKFYVKQQQFVSASWEEIGSGSGLDFTAEKTGAYTAGIGELVLVDLVTAAANVTIDAPTSPVDGDKFGVKLNSIAGAYKVIIDPSPDLIDGAATLELTVDYDYASFQYDGSNWVEVGSEVGNKVARFNEQFSNAYDVVTLADLPNIVLDASVSSNFQVTLGGSRTLNNPTGTSLTKAIYLLIKQDGVGSHAIAFSSNWIAADISSAINPLPNAVSLLTAFERDTGGGPKWYYVISHVNEGDAGVNVIQMWTQPNVFPDNAGLSSHVGMNTVFASVQEGDLVLLGPFSYRVDAPVIIDGQNNVNARAFTIRGANTSAAPTAPTAIWWSGGVQPSVDMFSVDSSYINIEGVRLYVAPGAHQIRSLFYYGDLVGPTVLNNTNITVSNVLFGPGDFDSGARLDDPLSAENCAFIDCFFDLATATSGTNQAGVHTVSGSSFGTSMLRCTIKGGVNGAPHGTGLLLGNSSNVTFAQSITFLQLETCVVLASLSKCRIVGMVADYCGRMVDTVGALAGTSLAVIGGTYGLTDSQKATTGPFIRPEGDDSWGLFLVYGIFTLDNVVLGTGYGPGTTDVLQTGLAATISIKNCILPNASVFKSENVQPAQVAGGFTVENCVYTPSYTGDLIPCPEWHGKRNSENTVTFTGYKTTRRIPLPFRENSTFNYNVVFSLRNTSALATVSPIRVTAKALHYFEATIELPAGFDAGDPDDVDQYVQYNYRVTAEPKATLVPTAVDSLIHQWDASLGVTVAPATQNVTIWTDQIGGEQLTNVGTPVRVLADPLTAGLDSIVFAAGSGNKLVSTRPPSFWRYLSDASTDYTIVLVFHSNSSTGNSAVVGTFEFTNTAGIGFYGAPNTYCSLYTSNGASFSENPRNSSDSYGDVFSAGLNFFWARVHRTIFNTRSFGDSKSKDQGNILSHGANIDGGAYAPRPQIFSPSDPGTTFTVRSSFLGSNATMRFCEILIYDRKLSDFEMLTLEDQYLNVKYKGFLSETPAYYGVGAAGLNSEAQIEALAGASPAKTRKRKFVVSPSNEKVYYAYKKTFGPAKFYVNDLPMDFLAPFDLAISDDFGIYGTTETYTVYESTNLLTGTNLEIVVK